MGAEHGRRGRDSLAGAVLVITALVLAAACGGDGNKAASSTTTGAPAITVAAGRACEVVTKAEVEAAIGTGVGNGQPGGGGAAALCKYELAGSPQSVLVAITGSTDAQDFQNARSAAQGAQPIPGLSNAEGFAAGGRAFVLKGTTLAIIAVNLERPDPAKTEAARKLAQAAAGRI